MHSGNIFSLIPPAVVMILAIWLKRPILALVTGTVVGLMIYSFDETLTLFAEISLKVMQDETIGWLILVCGGFGALINLLIHTGGAIAFGKFATRFARGPRSTMFMTFLLGMIIFIDDYLNALSVGEAMKRVCDRYKISRQMLAYIVDSTAAPVCVIIPISTWAIFFGGLLVDNGIAEKGREIDVYMSAIPYMLYPWAALFLVFLVALKIMPAIGPMKRAEVLAQTGTNSCDEGSFLNTEKVDPRSVDEYARHAMSSEFDDRRCDGKLRNFLVPMLALIAFTIYFDIDVWKGLLCTFVITIPYYLIQKLLAFAEMMEIMMNGFKVMLPAICTVIAAFLFKDVCDRLLLPQYVIANLAPYMTPKLLPAAVFLAMSLLSFTTGSSWGIFAVSIPIVMPLANSVGAELPLVIGALLSAASFGSQACFYSDSTVLAAQGSGCDLISHALTQLPYCLIAALIATTGYIVIGVL